MTMNESCVCWLSYFDLWMDKLLFPLKNILKENSSQTILATFKHEGVDLTGCHYQPKAGQDEDLGSI